MNLVDIFFGLILKYSKINDQNLIEVFGDKSLINFEKLTDLLNHRKKFASSVKKMKVKNEHGASTRTQK